MASGFTAISGELENAEDVGKKTGSAEVEIECLALG
jgi:hypothetical protein